MTLSSLRRARRLRWGLTFFGLLLITAPCIVLLIYDGMTFLPALFLTEYLKFLGTVLTVTLGWILIHVYWKSVQESQSLAVFRRVVAEHLTELTRHNIETMQLLDLSHGTMELADRDRYVEANINRQRDAVQALKRLRDYSMASVLDLEDTADTVDTLVSKLEIAFKWAETAPYTHVRHINEAIQTQLIEVGELCEEVLLELTKGHHE